MNFSTMQKQYKVISMIMTGISLFHTGDGYAEEVNSVASTFRSIFEANHFEKDFGVTIGEKLWMNRWSLPAELPNSSSPTSTIYQFDSDDEVASLTTLLVRYRNFFIGAGFLPETNYNFKSQTTSLSPDKTAVEGKRKEWDLNLGYFITPNLSVIAGYKQLDRNYIYTLPSQGLKLESPLSVKGLIIGISATNPLGKSFGFYGNLAYGWLKGDYVINGFANTFDFDVDGNYIIAELGINYSIPMHKILSAMTISAGYRIQHVDINADNSDGQFPNTGKSGTQDDSATGFTVSISATF